MHRAKGDRFVRANELPVRQCNLTLTVRENLSPSELYNSYTKFEENWSKMHAQARECKQSADRGTDIKTNFEWRL